MKYVLLVLLLCLNLYATLEEEYRLLSPNEKRVLFNSYQSGKGFDLGLTLAAIAWQESMGGRWQIGTSSSDYGIYHINIYWYLKEIHVPDTKYNRSKYATIILLKPKLAELYVITKLLNLRLVYKDYMTIWKKYNGSGLNSKLYAIRIRDKVKFLSHKFINK